MHFCAMYSPRESVEELIEVYNENSVGGHVLRILNDKNEDALLLAARKGNIGGIAALLPLSDYPKYQLLREAIASNNADAVKLILAAMPEKEGLRKDSSYVLDAVQNDNIDVLQMLIEEGASVRYTPGSVTNCGHSHPVYYLASARTEIELSMLKMVLEAGADVNTPFVNASPLEYSLSHGAEEAIIALIDAGADVSFERTLNERIFNAKTVVEMRHRNIRKGDVSTSRGELLPLSAEAMRALKLAA